MKINAALAVDRHPARGDQSVGTATGGDPGRSKKLVQPHG